MGKISNSINHYLSDNRRFADLFNGVCFRGETIVCAEDLLEGSQVYHETIGEVRRKGKGTERRERIRDICKLLKTGETLRVLALENQQIIDYTMPFRCMQYDVMEYGKQMDTLKKKNKRENHLESIAEKMCGIKRTDRLVPVYTLCLYHGMDQWDGPRTLSDMMDFEGRKDSFRKIFKDYPMQLYCLNEAQDLQVFHTELGILFQALQYRKDRVGLRKLTMQDARYRYLDADTLETMSVMLELPSIWKERKKYMEKSDDGEVYDMCQAVREWAEEERSIGRTEGVDEKTHTIVRNMLSRSMSDEDIMAIAECSQEFIDKVRTSFRTPL